MDDIAVCEMGREAPPSSEGAFHAVCFLGFESARWSRCGHAVIIFACGLKWNCLFCFFF